MEQPSIFDAVILERAQCCRDICGSCRAYNQPRRYLENDWVHPQLKGGDTSCPASPIWERDYQEELERRKPIGLHAETDR
jgi:hypothetical protein